DGQVASRRIASLPIEEPLQYRDGAEYVEQFHSILGAAVRDRLPSGKTAFFLSGGLDSTSIAAIAKQERPAEQARDTFHAFTIDFRPLLDDPEPRLAGAAADHIGIPIQLVKSGAERPFSHWTESNLRLPEPLHEPFQCRHVALAGEIFTFSRVVLSGDGG